MWLNWKVASNMFRPYGRLLESVNKNTVTITDVPEPLRH